MFRTSPSITHFASHACPTREPCVPNQISKSYLSESKPALRKTPAVKVRMRLMRATSLPNESGI